MKQRGEKTSSGTGFPACAGKGDLVIQRRNLPHWQLLGSTYFVTFRLKTGHLSENERQIVLDAVKHFHNIRYWLTAAVVMPDHVHLMLQPIAGETAAKFLLSKILQGIKGFSAREINKHRRAKGAVWQDESYDRIVRDYEEFLEKWHYLRSNPVKSELCQTPEEYPFLWEPGEAPE
jgi:REP element-mobilizing transposase RayT